MIICLKNHEFGLLLYAKTRVINKGSLINVANALEMIYKKQFYAYTKLKNKTVHWFPFTLILSKFSYNSEKLSTVCILMNFVCSSYFRIRLRN